MKKIISLMLIVSLLIYLVACDKNEPKEITCEEIIKAYEDAEYFVTCHNHRNDSSEDSEQGYCYIIIHETNDYDSDLIEINIFLTEEEAKKAANLDNYHVVNWMFASILGESRWLKSGSYGRIEYSTYNSGLLKPLEQLMK